MARPAKPKPPFVMPKPTMAPIVLPPAPAGTQGPVDEEHSVPELALKPFEEMTLKELQDLNLTYLTEEELNRREFQINKLTNGLPVLPTKPVIVDLRTDGPTPKEWTERGYSMSNYPPEGYAAKDDAPEESTMSAEVRRVKESRTVLKSPPGPNQRYFEAPDGTIIVGESKVDRVWFDKMNGGKGGWINPYR